MEPSHIEACRIMVKSMDVLLGAGSCFYDKDRKRRQLYGKAGAFRPKAYGVEYRSLSNAWLSDIYLTRFVAENSFEAFKINMTMAETQKVQALAGDISNKLINDESEFFNPSVSYGVLRQDMLNRGLAARGPMNEYDVGYKAQPIMARRVTNEEQAAGFKPKKLEEVIDEAIIL